MNYNKKHVKRIAYKLYLININGKYKHKDFQKWYRQTAFELSEMQQAEKYYR